MCGIVGMAGDFSYQEKDAFTDMLTVCQVRGRDSTGVFSVRYNDEVRWMKDIGSPERLIDSKHYDKWLLEGVPKVLVGHCRHKTTGAVNRHNAHPFEIDHIIGVHNGTLVSAYKMKHNAEYDVDSQVLYRNIAEYGIEEAISEIPDGSAYALVWWDSKEKTLNFLRNEKRPLYFTWSSDLKTLLWASETWMFGAYHRGFQLWGGGEDGKVFYELPVDTLFSFEVDGNPGKDKPALKMHPMRIIKPAKPEKGGTGSSVVPFRGPYGNAWGIFDDDDEAPIYNVNYQNGKESAAPAGKEGDSVPAPFRSGSQDQDDQSVEASRSGSEKENNSQGSPGESSSTKSSSTGAEHRSSMTSDSGQDSKSSKSTKRQILSTTSLTSNNSPSNNNGRSSASCETVSKLLSPKRMTSVRTVAGVSYITDNMTKQEWSFHEFHKNTNGICGFCHTPIGDEREVFAFIKPEKFICTNCVGETEDDLLIPDTRILG